MGDGLYGVKGVLLGLAFLLLVLSAASCGGGMTGGSAPTDSNPSLPPVPLDVQQLIHDQYGELAFLPTRVPDDYGFRDWSGSPGGFEIYFGPGSAHEMDYAAGTAPCGSLGNSMHTFKANGVQIEWSATYEDQQAWRCLTVDGYQVVIEGSRSVPGDDSLDTPGRLQDAQQLVDLVAYAQVAL